VERKKRGHKVEEGGRKVSLGGVRSRDENSVYEILKKKKKKAKRKSITRKDTWLNYSYSNALN
jgi:hypothetical protein